MSRKTAAESICPGCGLRMPARPSAIYTGYYHTTPECWSVYTEVLGAEFQNAVLFGQVHQTTVDTYAAQHAGGAHKDKSIAVHLVGLHLAIDRDLRSTAITALLQRLAAARPQWPHFDPPADAGAITVLDVALSVGDPAHVAVVRSWARAVWDSWAHCHPEVVALAAAHLDTGGARKTPQNHGVIC